MPGCGLKAYSADVPEEKIVVEDDVVHDDFAWPRVSDKWRVPIRRSALSAQLPNAAGNRGSQNSLFSSLLLRPLVGCLVVVSGPVSSMRLRIHVARGGGVLSW
jgi:hypothetical protein